MSARAIGLLFGVACCLTVVALAEPPEGAPAATSGKQAAAKARTAAAEVAEADKRLADEEYYELYRAFADTMDQVERNYVKKVSRRELMEAAIKGMLTKLDPYSNYISEEDLGEFKTSVENQFGGIGIQVSQDGDQLSVISPIYGSPAYRAGVQAGDRILKIDGAATRDMSLDEAVKKLKGELGTKVALTVQHPGASQPETIEIARDNIHLESVFGARRKNDDTWDYMLDASKGIGYIRVSAFGRDTAEEVKKAVTELNATGKLRGLILDLRFNPGGLLNSAVEIADLFVTKGVIVSTEGRSTAKRVWTAEREPNFEGFPMVVLVNKYSASASEIVAACLQDHKRAVVIGQRTFGKGSVQNVIELEQGKTALKLTTAGYQRPNGHNIHRFPGTKDSDEWGVKPNAGMEVALSLEDSARLLDAQRRLDILGRGRKTRATSRSEEFVDRQLRKAVDYLTSEMARR